MGERTVKMAKRQKNDKNYAWKYMTIQNNDKYPLGRR